MSEREIKIPTADGAMSLFITAPEGDGPHPAVIQYMDVGGIRDELKDMARRYTEAGVAVVQPDLYHHFGEGIAFDMGEVFRDEDKRAEMFGLMGQLTPQVVAADTRAVLDFLDADEAFDNSPRGAVGYCFGGKAVVQLLAEFPEELRLGAALHPSALVTDAPDSPHRGFARFAPDAELYLGLGGEDQFAAPEQVKALRSELEANDVDATIDVTPGADHGFTMRSRGPVYNAEADALHWGNTISLFSKLVA